MWHPVWPICKWQHVVSVADPDPGSSAFLTPGSGFRYSGSGMGKKSGSGSRIRNEQPYFLELGNHFSVLKYLNSLIWIRYPDSGWEKFGSGIRDGKKSDPGSGKTFRIRNTTPGTDKNYARIAADGWNLRFLCPAHKTIANIKERERNPRFLALWLRFLWVIKGRW